MGFWLPSVANMASPWHEGTHTSTAFSSAYLDILNEELTIVPDATFSTALVTAHYRILCSYDSLTIPLLFYAVDYDYNTNGEEFPMEISHNGDSVKLFHYPYEASDSVAELLEMYPFIDNEGRLHEMPEVEVKFNEFSSYQLSISDLYYFVLELDSGIHDVVVQYQAKASIYLGNWVKEKSFKYSLSPAKYWKSFGGLTLTIDNSAGSLDFNTNLDTEPLEVGAGVFQWRFDELPAEFLEITHRPAVSKFATLLISVGPLGIALIVGAVLILLHIWWMKRVRKAGFKKFRVVLMGGFLFPFLFLLSYIFSYPLIDVIIGLEASKYHGYEFLAILFYVVIAPIYILFAFLVDWIIRRRLKHA